MSYENSDRKWMEDNFRQITQKLSEIDKFMGAQIEVHSHRLAQIAELREEIEDLTEKVDRTDTKLEGLLQKISKWEAKLGSFMFIAGCLWAFFVAMKDTIMAFVKGAGA